MAVKHSKVSSAPDDGSGKIGGPDWNADHVIDSGTVAHTDLASVSADQHHAKSHGHTGADGSGTVTHSDTTGKTADDHHAQTHSDTQHTDGPNSKPGHSHTEANVTNLVSDLAGKSATGHAHAESDVTSLVTDLAGKAPTSHAHTESDVTGLPADLSSERQPNRIITGAGERFETRGPGDRGPGQIITGGLVVGTVLLGTPKIPRSSFMIPPDHFYRLDGTIATGPNIRMTTNVNATLETANLNSVSRLYTPGRG